MSCKRMCRSVRLKAGQTSPDLLYRRGAENAETTQSSLRLFLRTLRLRGEFVCFNPNNRRKSDQNLHRVTLFCFAAWLLLFSFSPVSLSQVGSFRPRTLAEDTTWRLALPGYQFSFPQDHAAHKPYRLEWWYYTGNLESREGRQFGYQLTFFRFGVAFKPLNPSRWAIRDLYLAHFALSDIDQGSFKFFERINRAGVGWAGAEEDKYRVWNEDWEAWLDGGDHILTASDDNFGIDLRLVPEKPEIINGADGVSQKGALPGNASHYYSITRMRTSGRITVGGERFDATGLSWMDHEFGSSFLEESQVGWDWFSIQLEDGRDLMLFQLRRSDGSIDSHSGGTLVEPDGHSSRVVFGEFTMTPQETWKSTESGATYPTAWVIDLPRFGLRLNARAAFGNQELNSVESAGVTYWEGSVLYEGTSGDREVRGRGYLEMTGYARLSMGSIMN